VSHELNGLETISCTGAPKSCIDLKAYASKRNLGRRPASAFSLIVVFRPQFDYKL